MKVLFDAQIFRQQRYGGISRYFCELATRLDAMPGVAARIVAPHHRNEYLASVPAPVVVGWHLGRWKRLGKLARLAGRVVERRTTAREAPDIVHETYYWGSPLRDPRARRVLTVYDMIHERFPQHFAPDEPTAAAKRRAVAEADHVICISHCTKRDLMALLDVPEHKVSVTHLSADMKPPPEPPRPDRAPYILYVGDRGGYKNFLGVVAAVGASPALRSLRLACFGGGDLKPEEWAAIDRAGIERERIVQQHGDDTALARLYAGAEVFVYPSLYEGFGIPPLEAMRCDCPVACSNTSSIPEVVGDAAQGFDPADTDSIRQALEAVAGVPSRQAELVARGREQLQKFSWERCAAETLDVYRRVAGGTAHA
ncbi:Glycosyl transferase group 1 [Rubrivivax sp. A210]|uniref:glycosyltransferase family 4 protein n=1 Tax=Rubrivivax sp. A210 TaxID=2772301 RepID=UPI00191985C4|nr:glycosyltransferase family 1 protein [Rubrivivax sp. A210]CAD5373972.1 Glycosyl transferase group 1 [Rubrivivax sp. A210]